MEEMVWVQISPHKHSWQMPTSLSALLSEYVKQPNIFNIDNGDPLTVWYNSLPSEKKALIKRVARK